MKILGEHIEAAFASLPVEFTAQQFRQALSTALGEQVKDYQMPKALAWAVQLGLMTTIKRNLYQKIDQKQRRIAQERHQHAQELAEQLGGRAVDGNVLLPVEIAQQWLEKLEK